MSEEIKFASLFRGIGGFELGLERNGFKCVWSNDIDKYASIIYKKHWPETPEVTGDIRDIKAKDIPAHDILCGGFPCQSFSVAGKRKGFKDTRGTLFFEICRIAEYHRPKLLLLENVKGLLSAGLNDESGESIPGTGGQVFETILKSLEELGYWWEYQVLNSKNYGVPQNRERVFIIGHLRTGSTRPIFPITKTDGVDQLESGRKGVQVETSSAIHSRYGAGWREHGQKQLISTAIDANYFKGPDKHGQRTMIAESRAPLIIADRSRHLNKKGRNLESPKPYANSLTASPKDNLLALRHVRTDRGKQARRDNQKNGFDDTPFGEEFRAFVPSNEPVTGTVTTGINKDALIGHNTRIRRLTPVECERLQGFPDNWTEGISDTQRYKCLGNAVTVNVIEFLGHRLRTSINSKRERTTT